MQKLKNKILGTNIIVVAYHWFLATILFLATFVIVKEDRFPLSKDGLIGIVTCFIVSISITCLWVLHKKKIPNILLLTFHIIVLTIGIPIVIFFTYFLLTFSFRGVRPSPYKLLITASIGLALTTFLGLCSWKSIKYLRRENN